MLDAQQHAHLGPRHGLDDARDHGRVAMDVAAPVLGQHEHVLDLSDSGKELALVIGQPRLGVVLLRAWIGVARLGQLVLPAQARSESLMLRGNSTLLQFVLASWWVRVA